ncbi:hypothetical protein [Shewanella gelidii]|uniref:Uncharacterized protein n=1 Tax=Shewanella gelidii TaxID=1642821 RepID=A0A917N7H1_9GAMM|nr:hypothetical protein [Shewanella gelidii]MCL1096408.1 hypothetical protein [Shewanella gelidii]GGI67222.1 hypothetical protein GCM10009332_00360 [Shewanella gelidii]
MTLSEGIAGAVPNIFIYKNMGLLGLMLVGGWWYGLICKLQCGLRITCVGKNIESWKVIIAEKHVVGRQLAFISKDKSKRVVRQFHGGVSPYPAKP